MEQSIQQPLFRKAYLAVFSTFYFAEGLNVSILSAVVPIYLILTLGTIGAAQIGAIGSITMIPWALKFIYGIVGDKFYTSKFGRRRQWIMTSGILAGIFWLCAPVLLKISDPIFTIYLVGTFGSLGFAIADTSIDGLILDVTPPEILGKTQGFCWSFRSLGTIAGGPLITLIFLSAGLDVTAVFIFFGIITIIAALTTSIVKESLIPPSQVNIGTNLKKMFKSSRNWRIYIWSIVHTLTEGVFFLYLALFILILFGYISPEGATLNVLDEDINLYTPQAIVNLLVGVGIVAGAMIGGTLADKKNRKFAALLGYAISAGSCILLILPINAWVALILAILCGAGLGWRNATYSAILGQYSKEYPEMTSTFFSFGTSFCNVGLSMGLSIVAWLFATLGGKGLEYQVVYRGVFAAIALMLVLAPISFYLLNPKEYEISK